MFICFGIFIVEHYLIESSRTITFDDYVDVFYLIMSAWTLIELKEYLEFGNLLLKVFTF